MFKSTKEEYLEILQDYGLPIYDEDDWWVKFPKRAANEICKMQENSYSVLSVSGDKLVWHIENTTNYGNEYLMTLEVGFGYPSKQPSVYLLDPKITPRAEIHIWNSGELCLFKPEVYHSGMSLLDIRNKAAAWCLCYDIYVKTGKWGGAEAPHL